MIKNIWREFAEVNGLSQEEFFDEIVTATMAAMSMKLDNQEKDTLIVTKGVYKLSFTEIQA